MRLSSLLFSALLGLTMSANVLAQQPAPVRTFDEMLGALPREEVRPLLGGNLSHQEKNALAMKLGQTLTANERDKKWTFKFTRAKGGNLYDTDKAGTTFFAAVDDKVRVNGVPYTVTMSVRITPEMMDKVKECAVGRKIFITGTVNAANILVSNTPILSLHVTAEDLGRAKG